MSNVSFQQKIKLQSHNMIMLCRGKTADGQALWSYVQVSDAQTMQRMQDDYAHGKTVIFSDYGEVVKEGWGEEPPQDVKEWIKEHYDDA